MTDQGARWPTVLRTLADVARAALRRRGYDDATARADADAIIEEIALYAGGRPLYLPKGLSLETQRRNEAIYREFNGKNVIELSEKYGLTSRAIYLILSQFRKKAQE